jgi:protein TonB
MLSILEGARLEREITPEPIGGPALGAIVLHVVLGGLLLYYGWILGLFHHDLWGNQGAGGAMQVNLVSSALPLPADQINQNVLATETPSQAPAEANQKQQRQAEKDAIEIASKKAKPQTVTTPKTIKNPAPAKQNTAQYGEQAGSIMPRSVQPQTASNGPANVGDSDFASRFGWYVDQINRKMANSWYRQEVDPRTPRTTRVYLVFTISRDGSPSGVSIDRSSGSTTLDRSCMRGVQRVDTFGSLPPDYKQSTLKVSYYCEY